MDKFLNSSIGKKVLMAATGLFLCSFLLIHLIGNFQLLSNDGGEAFNKYAVFMTTFPLIKAVSYLLYISIILHALMALRLTLQNNAARPVSYDKYDGAANSKWYARKMGTLGTVVLIFIVMHMAGFWWRYKFGEMPKVSYGGEEFKDLYVVVKEAFSQAWIVAIYVIAQIAIGFHLAHGFQSGFQSLGLNHKKYTPVIKSIGIWIFAVLIPAGFASIPVIMFLNK
jgi:succinate dehydrogenase / fumarate reductase, cytochrome b subunit